MKLLDSTFNIQYKVKFYNCNNYKKPPFILFKIKLKLHTVYLVSLKTCSSNIFKLIILYVSKNIFLNLISSFLIDEKKFNGIIRIPPKHLFIVNSFKKHLNKSF